MQDLAAEVDSSRIVSILPYRLKALKRRQQAARAALHIVPSPRVAEARLSSNGSGHQAEAMRAGIRHIASGRMTLTHARLQTVMTMMTKRTANRRGLLEDPRLEAVLVDEQRQVFAGFWPE